MMEKESQELSSLPTLVYLEKDHQYGVFMVLSTSTVLIRPRLIVFLSLFMYNQVPDAQ